MTDDLGQLRFNLIVKAIPCLHWLFAEGTAIRYLFALAACHFDLQGDVEVADWMVLMALDGAGQAEESSLIAF